jgi:hypothetical protein
MALAALVGAGVLAAALVGLGAAVVVVQTLDPAGSLDVGAATVLAGRLLLLAQGGELRAGPGPIVLAPLLLTAGWPGACRGPPAPSSGSAT